MKSERSLLSLFLIIVLAVVANPSFATEAPILDFDLRQGSGATVTDSASGIVGTTHGTVWALDPSGRPALYFDNSIKYWFGDGDWFVIPDHAALDSPQITLESWVYPLSSGTYTVFVERIQDYQTFSFSIYMGLKATTYTAGTKPTFRLDRTAPGVWQDATSPTDITLHEWHHVVGTYDGTDMLLYVDGEHVATTAVGVPRGTGSNPLYLGHAPTGNHYFNGYFARFKMYDRALNADEVAHNFVSENEADSDGDGVNDPNDFCPGTTIPEAVPTTLTLNPNHWALIDDDLEFDTLTKGKGKGPSLSYTTTDTAGCSCEQIIEAQGLGNGHMKFGCSISAMDDWFEIVNP